MAFYGYGRINVVGFGATAAELTEGASMDTDGRGMHVVEYELDGDNRPPDYGILAEVITTLPASGLTVVNEEGTVTIKSGELSVATGLVDDDINLTDLAAVMDTIPGCEVDSAIQQACWNEGDIGGASSFWSPRYRMRADSSDALDDAMEIDLCLRGNDTAQVAGLIAAGAKEQINNITNLEQRRHVADAVASELVDHSTYLNSTETD